MAYGDERNRGLFLNIIDWAFCSISLVVVALRLVSRRLLEENHWGVDDGCVLLAMAIVLLRTIYISFCIHLGLGQPLDSSMAQDPDKAILLTELLFILEAFSLWTWTLPKISIATLLVRLFRTHGKRLALALYSLVGFLVICVAILSAVTFIQCTPVAKNWDRGMGGICWDNRVYLAMACFTTAYSATLDFAFYIYAICKVYSLQIERSRKILIALSLSLGIPAGVTTVYKLTTIGSIYDDRGLSWAIVPLEAWNSVESCALIIAVAIPITRPLAIVMGGQIRGFAMRIVGLPTFDNPRTTKHSDISNKEMTKHFQRRNSY